MAFNWTCPYCSMTQTVTSDKQTGNYSSLKIDGQAEGFIAMSVTAIACANPKCLKTTVQVNIAPAEYTNGRLRHKIGSTPLFSQRLMPQGNAKPQPNYVPDAIREDYYEACLIRDLSPKASATLTRRCLQGMIRDFAGIAKGRLIDEIKALRDAVHDGSADRSITLESVEAINHVRGVGNIGAHMEKQIDQIVPVDPGEAQALIELVEMLFEEWYGARARRKERLERIASIAEDKEAIKSTLKSQSAAAPSEAKSETNALSALLKAAPETD